MKAAIADACVLIDLANGALLDAWFQLGIETHTTDLVLRQALKGRQRDAVEARVKSGLLKIETLTGEQLLQMLTELGQLPVGVEDQSALYLAMKLDAILVTGDRRLRLEGLRKSLEVRGVLWILDAVVARGHLTPKLAVEKLEILLAEGAFLPTAECARRFKNWRRLV